MNNLIAEKADETRRILDELKIDAWITFVRESLECGDPVLPLIFPYSLTWQSALLMTREHGTIAIVADHDAEAVESVGTWSEVIGYTDGIREPLHQVIRRINPQAIAINSSADDYMADGLSSGMHELLRRYLPEHQDRFISAAPIISRLRGRKSSAELKLIQDAIVTSEAIFRAVGEFAQVGTTEMELADFMRDRAYEQRLGLAWDEQMCPIVTTGPESMGGHAVPSRELGVQRGCVLNLDFGIRKNGYCSDNQRSWYVLQEGETAPPEPVQHAFDTIRAGIAAAMEVLKPGVEGWQVDDAARSVITSAGYSEYDHGTGHQIGRCAHDGGASLAPRWERYGDTPMMPIEPGNVFTIEPSIGDVDGRGYMALEEIVMVTGEGCELLSTPQQQLWLLR